MTKVDPEVSRFIPAHLLRRAEAVHGAKADAKGLELEMLTGAGCEREMLGEAALLSQVLDLLLERAVSGTVSGEIAVRLSCRPGKPLVLDVTDTGATALLAGGEARLLLVEAMVARATGQMQVEHQTGEGTRVRITLPILAAEQAVPEAPVAVPPVEGGPSLSGRHLLIADDNATNRLVLSEMLSGTGSRLTKVENGVEVIDAWADAHSSGTRFDLLLLDITMPVMDGVSALCEIRRRELQAGLPPVPAVAVTANAMPHQVAIYIESGFDSHLAKPFRYRDLMGCIERLL